MGGSGETPPRRFFFHFFCGLLRVKEVFLFLFFLELDREGCSRINLKDENIRGAKQKWREGGGAADPLAPMWLCPWNYMFVAIHPLSHIFV